MGCGTGCLKVLVVFFNILFWIFGLGLLCIGVWVKVDRDVANLGQALKLAVENEQDYVDIAAWIFIGAGIFTFLVGFIGCCGAIRESQGLLAFYVICLIVAFAAEITVVALIGWQYPKVVDNISNLGSIWVKTNYDGKSLTSRGFNYVQLEFCCCGVANFRDYKGSKFVADGSNEIMTGAYMSFACCKPVDNTETNYADISPANRAACEAEAITQSRSNSSDIAESDCMSVFRSQGCKDKLIEWVQERLPIFIGVAAGVAGVQVLGFILSVCMCVHVKRDKE